MIWAEPWPWPGLWPRQWSCHSVCYTFPGWCGLRVRRGSPGSRLRPWPLPWPIPWLIPWTLTQFVPYLSLKIWAEFFFIEGQRMVWAETKTMTMIMIKTMNTASMWIILCLPRRMCPSMRRDSPFGLRTWPRLLTWLWLRPRTLPQCVLYLPLKMWAECEKGQPMVWAETMTMTSSSLTCCWSPWTPDSRRNIWPASNTCMYVCQCTVHFRKICKSNTLKKH
jgi:hypothetical protein